MELTPLTAISAIDGRYRNKCERLDEYFSEYALIKYRIRVEIEYFIALTRLGLPQLPKLSHIDEEVLRGIYRNFTLDQAERVKQIESVTNHDVKAVEYFIKEQFDALHLSVDITEYKEFIHFGLTSQDINNTAVPMSIREALTNVYMPMLERLTDEIRHLAEEWADIPMLAKTHGQPASPTRLGKELMVFVYRLDRQIEILRKTKITGKFGGATGNFNAHHVAFPDIDWK